MEIGAPYTKDFYWLPLSRRRNRRDCRGRFRRGLGASHRAPARSGSSCWRRFPGVGWMAHFCRDHLRRGGHGCSEHSSASAGWAAPWRDLHDGHPRQPGPRPRKGSPRVRPTMDLGPACSPMVRILRRRCDGRLPVHGIRLAGGVRSRRSGRGNFLACCRRTLPQKSTMLSSIKRGPMRLYSRCDANPLTTSPGMAGAPAVPPRELACSPSSPPR